MTGDFRKSTFSGPDDNCVGVRRDLCAVQDTKHDATVLSAPALSTLVQFVKDNRLQTPAAS